MDTMNKVMDMSVFIQKAISQQDWSQVQRLDKERRQLIHEYYTSNENVDEQQTRKLKKINDEIIAQLTQIQQKTQNAQLDLRHGNNAARAYLDTAAK